MAGLNSTVYSPQVGLTHRMHRDDDSDATVTPDVDNGPPNLLSVLEDSSNAAITYLNVYDHLNPSTSDYPIIRLKCAANGKVGGGGILGGVTGGGLAFRNGLSWKTGTSADGTGNPATPPVIRVITDKPT